jgi:hypothetical protein
MDWIKRNLFFVVGGVIALALLGGAGWYLYSKIDLNNQKWETLNKDYEQLKTLNQQPVHPGAGAVDNIKTAKEQLADLKAFQDKLRPGTNTAPDARLPFKRIHPIPDVPGVMQDRDFSFALSRTILALRTDATNSGVALPPEYDFSFLAQTKLLSFPTNYLRPLATQLGEVKAICDVLFQAKINALDALRRERIASEDTAGSSTDYIGDKSTTNELAVLTPYEMTFRCFSPELAAVLSNFASSEHGFVVKTINVEAEGAALATTDASGNPVPPGATPFPGEGVPTVPGRGPYIPGRTPPSALTTPATPSRGLPIVLDEKKLRVTISLVLVKVLPLKETATSRPAGPRPATPIPGA